MAQQRSGNARKFPEPKTRIELEENEDLEVAEGFGIGTSDTTGQRDLAFRRDRGVAQPLLIVLAAVALVAVATFLSIYCGNGRPVLPTVVETLPAPDVNSQVKPDPLSPATP